MNILTCYVHFLKILFISLIGDMLTQNRNHHPSQKKQTQKTIHLRQTKFVFNYNSVYRLVPFETHIERDLHINHIRIYIFLIFHAFIHVFHVVLDKINDSILTCQFEISLQ